MKFEDIRDPLVRAAAERLVRDTGKPLHVWMMSADEPVLRRLLIRRHYLVDYAAEPAKPFDGDILEIRLALRGLSSTQRRGLAYGDPAIIELAAEMVIEHLRLSGISLHRQPAKGEPEACCLFPAGSRQGQFFDIVR